MTDIKDKILASIKRVRKDMDITLVWNDWGSFEKKCACPMGCVLLDDNPENEDLLSDDGIDVAAKILEVEDHWITSFIEGYDLIGSEKDAIYPEAWRLGKELHEELKPVVFGAVPPVAVKEKKNGKRR